MTSDLKSEIMTDSKKLSFDSSKIQDDFPILETKINGHRLVYLDNAASSQKPEAVINALDNFYKTTNSNIHRGLHTLAEKATNAYEHCREHVAKFIGGVSCEEIIFTSGTTESTNLVANSWGNENIGEGDEILITEMEHHANLVPWVLLAQKKNALLRQIPITTDGTLDLTDINKLINEKTKLLAVTHMSNVLGTINPIKELIELAHKNGALTLIDGAQAVPHMPVDVKDLNADFYCFSSHKMLGPTGVGVLYGKKEILEKMPPYILGGEMIREVSFEKVTFNDLPHKFEAGTPNIADVVAFDTALTYLENIGMENIRNHEIEISKYAIEKLTEIEGITIQGPLDETIRGAAISFTDRDVHPHDISTFLDSRGIAIRAGHHCAQPLMKVLKTVATARASFYIYNDRADVDYLAETVKEMRRYFRG